MKPYYERGGITIYHGDSREILPDLPAVDVILTDPPWPMDSMNGKTLMEGSDRAGELWAEVAPLLRAQRILVWHAINNDPRIFLNPLSEWPFLRNVYLRRAIPGHFGRVLMDGEIIQVLGTWPKQREGRNVIPGGLSITWIGRDRVADHPGPRSLIACRFLVKWWSDPGDLILDPFMGSGTTVLSAKHLGRPAIGIEIEEKYCEMAARRLDQEVMLLDEDDVSPVEQPSLLPEET